MAWPNTPTCIPNEWRSKGAESLADAIGYGSKPGPGAAKADAFRDAYVWYDKS